LKPTFHRKAGDNVDMLAAPLQASVLQQTGRPGKSEQTADNTFLYYCRTKTTSANNARARHVQGGPKRKPLPNDQKIVLNRIKSCQ